MIFFIRSELVCQSWRDSYAGKRQSQTELMQIEAIYFPGYSSKNPNHNIQITNNIKITNTNDQNISITYWIIRRHAICFEF